MTGTFPERDWKYLKRLQPELLAALCATINRQAAEILQAPGPSAHATYLRLHKHVQESDEVVAECFNDWRRSQLPFRVLSLLRHGLLLPEHRQQLSPAAQEWLRKLESLRR